MTTVEPLLTLKEAAQRLGAGISWRTLAKACDVGDLVYYDIGKGRKVRWSDVCAWVETCRVEPSRHGCGSNPQIGADLQRGKSKTAGDGSAQDALRTILEAQGTP